MEISQGDLFDYDFGPRSNHLQEGKRPALVVQTNVLNRMDGYSNVIIVPVTSKENRSRTYVKIEPSPENGLSKTSWAITNQVFTVDKGGLVSSLGRISKTELFDVKQGLKISLSID